MRTTWNYPSIRNYRAIPANSYVDSIKYNALQDTFWTTSNNLYPTARREIDTILKSTRLVNRRRRGKMLYQHHGVDWKIRVWGTGTYLKHMEDDDQVVTFSDPTISYTIMELMMAMLNFGLMTLLRSWDISLCTFLELFSYCSLSFNWACVSTSRPRDENLNYFEIPEPIL